MKKLKPLLRIMGYETLEQECEREGWEIPTEDDLRYQSTDWGFSHFSLVWTKDIVPDELYTEEDRKYNVKLGYAFDVGLQKNVVVNKNFMLECVILKEVN